MAESLTVLTKQDITVQFASYFDEPYNSSGTLHASNAGSYDLALPIGAVKPTLPRRMVNFFKSQGRPVAGTPLIRYGDTEDGALEVDFYFSDLSDTGAETMLDLLHWLSGFPVSGSYIASNWDSTMEASAGAGNAPVNVCGVKVTFTQEGNSSNVHGFYANYVAIDSVDWSPSEDAGKVTARFKFQARSGESGQFGIF